MAESRKRATSFEGSSSPKRTKLRENCQWFFQEPAFRAWSDAKSRSPFLWVHGSPGSGKTFLAHEILHKLRNNDPNVRVAHHFCDAFSTPRSIASSLWSQLNNEKSTGGELTAPGAQPVLVPTASEQGGFGLWDLIKDEHDKFGPKTLIIDGLDEIEGRFTEGLEYDLAQILVDLTASSLQTKILITSRPQPVLKKAFTDQTAVDITPENLREDLEDFIRTQSSRELSLMPLDDRTVQQMLERADGSFVKAQLVIAALKEAEATYPIPTALERLPRETTELYDFFLASTQKKLSPFELQLRELLLRWLACAVQPLSTSEVLNAFTVDTNALPTEFETASLSVVAPLIRIDDHILKPAHPTLRDYLLDHRPGIGLEARKCHGQLAKTCLRYLLHPAGNDIRRSLHHIEDIAAIYPLLRYASLYWVRHATLADTTDTELLELVKSFFAVECNAFVWADVLLPLFMNDSVLPIPPRSAHNARFFHLFMMKNQLVRAFRIGDPDIEERISTFLRETYEKALREARETSSDVNGLLERLMDMSAVYSWLPNERPKATQAIQEASELLEKNKGIIRKLGLQLLQVLGDDHKINGRYQAAEETYLSLLSRYQTTPVDADLQLMFAYDALGWVQMRLGDLEKAEVNLRRALQMAVASYGARSSLTLRSKVTLAEVLSKLGRSEEAEVLCAQLVDQLNQNHISGVSLPKDSISQLNALAQIFKTRGDHKGAKDAYAVVVEDRRKIFGNEHPMTLWAAAQLAASQRAAGEILEAQDAFIKLLPLQEKVLGSEHPDLKETRRHLQELETITG